MTTGRAAELRRAFDRSFAEPPTADVTAFENLLAIRIAGDPFALRLRDIGGLFAEKVITPLPTPAPELLGVAGFRGGVVPVYDLRALLGYAGREPTRWMALVAPIALAFDAFEGHLRVLPDAIASEARSDGGHVREVVRTADGARPIVHVASLLETITTISTRLRQRDR